MAYTLRDMLNTRAFQELQVIAGKDGLDNPVRYVGVLEAPDSVDFVKKHEFILTTGYVFSLQTDRMITMIRLRLQIREIPLNALENSCCDTPAVG